MGSSVRRFPGRKITAAMGIADMDFRTAPAITHALANRIGMTIGGTC